MALLRDGVRDAQHRRLGIILFCCTWTDDKDDDEREGGREGPREAIYFRSSDFWARSLFELSRAACQHSGSRTGLAGWGPREVCICRAPAGKLLSYRKRKNLKNSINIVH